MMSINCALNVYFMNHWKKTPSSLQIAYFEKSDSISLHEISFIGVFSHKHIKIRNFKKTSRIQRSLRYGARRLPLEVMTTWHLMWHVSTNPSMISTSTIISFCKFSLVTLGVHSHSVLNHLFRSFSSRIQTVIFVLICKMRITHSILYVGLFLFWQHSPFLIWLISLAIRISAQRPESPLVCFVLIYFFCIKIYKN